MAVPDVLTAEEAVAAHALGLIHDGARLGLGSGRAASVFIARLGERVREGLRVTAVPTSEASARQARELGIPLVELDEDVELDLTVDGADEVAPNLDLVKGGGGSLVRERIVASASRRQVILVGQEKLVRALGERGRLPVEVIPLARGPIMRRLKGLGLRPTVRVDADRARPFVTENGNLMLDCAPGAPLADARAARELEAALRLIPGVVDSGLFLGTAERVLVGYPDGRVKVLTRVTKEGSMELSARNQLRGTVKSVKPGAVMAEVLIDVGGQELTSVITKGSVDRLKLKAGDAVVAIVKATEVMIGK